MVARSLDPRIGTIRVAAGRDDPAVGAGIERQDRTSNSPESRRAERELSRAVLDRVRVRASATSTSISVQDAVARDREQQQPGCGECQGAGARSERLEPRAPRQGSGSETPATVAPARFEGRDGDPERSDDGGSRGTRSPRLNAPMAPRWSSSNGRGDVVQHADRRSTALRRCRSQRFRSRSAAGPAAAPAPYAPGLLVATSMQSERQRHRVTKTITASPGRSHAREHQSSRRAASETRRSGSARVWTSTCYS